MRFAFTGAHGTGKSSVLNGLADYLAARQIVVMNNSSSARHIVELGMNINESGDDLVQLIVQSSHVQKFCKDNWMTDRCVIDGYAYTEYLLRKGKVSYDTWHINHQLMQKFLPLYDHIFYIPIEFNVVGDNVRSEDVQFQRDIDKYIELVTTQEVQAKVTKLTGTIENRITQVKQVLARQFFV